MLTILTATGLWAQTNLTSGKTVVPLGGLKSYNNGTTDYTISQDDLQKITQDGNTANVYLFPEGGYDTEANRATGIQGFYIDMGASKSVGIIKSTWEGADAGGDIYVTNTEPAADGTLTGATLIATFTNAQEAAKDVAAQVDNSGRYIVFVPTEATNYAWGVKIRTFAAFEKEASVLSSLEVTPSVVKVGEATAMTFTAKDQVGIAITEGVTYTATGATLSGTTLTASAAGNVTITATYNGTSVSKTITAVAVSNPTTNPTEPTDLAANVIAVYSATYGKGLVDNNPAWGVGGGAPNPVYNSLEEVEIADGHKVVHVNGTGFNNRTAGGVGITSDYDKIHVALYPFTATTAKIFGDNAYGDAIPVSGLVPGQWNYVEVDNPGNQPNYILVELVGEQEFYLDHFYFSKPAVDDDEAPVLDAPVVKGVSPVSATLTLKANDNKSPKITYVVTDQNNQTYTTTGDNNTAIDFVVSPLQSNTAYTFSVVAKDNNENASAAQTVTATTTALAAAPVPTKEADKVLSIYSDTYTAATAYNYGAWGQSTAVEARDIDGNEALNLSNFNYLGFEYAEDIDLKDMDYVHIDVLPLQTMNLGITPIMRGGTPTEKPTSVGELTVGEWNSKDIKLSDFGLDYANFKSFQLKIDAGSGNDNLLVDNIYFWKGEGGDTPGDEPGDDPEEPATTSGSGSYTIPSGANEGKELKYTWAFTQTGMDVTVSFECTNADEIVGIVDGYVFDKTDGFAEHEGKAFTWENCTEGQVLKAAHKWMFAEGDFVTDDFTYTVKEYQQGEPEEPVVTLPAIPEEPTADAENVLAVYSATYGKEELTTTNPAWGGYKDATGEDLYTSFDYVTLTEGEATHKIVHVNGTGINSRTKDDAPATGYKKFHAAIYPKTATSGIIFKDNGYADRVTITDLVPGQWNYVEQDVDFDNNYITIALDNETEFYVDHIYYEKVESDEPGDNPGDEPGDEPGDNPGDDPANSIANVANTQQAAANTPMYNLQGQHVSNSFRGIVIVNGKKELRK